jgi:anti-sigma-K factor RskA
MLGMTDNRDELQAGEYVLGLLEGPVLAEFERRLAYDRNLQTAVANWREHFFAIDANVAPIKASATLLEKIETSVGRAGTVDAASEFRERLWSNIAFWRGTSFAGVAASLALAVAVVSLAGRATPKPIVVAVMQTAEMSPGAIVNAFADGSLTIVPLKDFFVPEGQTMQLWTLWDKAKGPVSVGLLSRSKTLHFERSDLPRGNDQLYEITLEPAGGSPTGKPTGPVLVKGFATTPRI